MASEANALSAELRGLTGFWPTKSEFISHPERPKNGTRARRRRGELEELFDNVALSRWSPCEDLETSNEVIALVFA
jgi:hypothetical protein